jgi:predicted Rossmann fold flavoprotein
MFATYGENEFDLAVVGSGAAGQLAAIAAAEDGKRVVLLEQMSRPGLKLLASGGGHANLTNMLKRAEFEEAFGRQGRFMEPALNVMAPTDLRRFLARLGVETIVDDQLHVYPASQRATDVQAALRDRIEHLGVQINLNCLVSRLWIEDGGLMGVETSDGQIQAQRVLLACGGKSYPELGGTGGGYSLAKQAGHSIAEPIPAMVPLVTQEPWPGKLAGVSLSKARVSIALPKQSKAGITGDILFTHRGLSGPAVINISGAVSQLHHRLGRVPIRIELIAGMDTSEWEREIESWRISSGKRLVLGLVREKIPASLARELFRLAGLDEQVTAAQLPTVGRKTLAGLLGSLELTVTGTDGFKIAFVTRGGVKLKEVDPKKLQSRFKPWLSLAGELLDLDGPTGGFNLQWAFASGWLAGKSC